MCGLVAMISKLRNGFNNANMDMFDIMLFVDQMRGQDSTGVFQVSNIGNVSILKQASHSTDFLNEPTYRTMRQDGIRNGWAMVGHNRKATKGAVTDKNAHPFWVDDKLVLVHNGSYFGDHKHLKDTEVDSEAIAHTLADAGDEGVEEAMQTINAAYALIWYDIQKKTINVLRNLQRPLFWVETSDAWYFCSDPDFIEFAAKRTNTVLLNGGPFSFDASSLDRWILKEDRSTALTADNINTGYRTFTERAAAQGALNFPPVCAVSWPQVNNDLDDQILSEEAAKAESESREIAIAALLKAQNKGNTDQTALVLVETKLPIQSVAPAPTWAQSHTYGQWLKAKETYPTGKRVRVECRDYISDDAGPGMVYLTGKTMDDSKLFVVFPVARELFEAITAPNSPAMGAKKAEFMVDIDVCGWRPAPKSNKKVHGVKPAFEDTLGVITLTAKKAKMYSDGKNSVQ